MNTSTMPPPNFVDLETAARLAGVTRRTLQKKLSSREIPAKAVKMDGLRKLVAVSALQSVFGPLKPSPQGDELHGTFQEAPPDAAELRANLAAKEAIIVSLQATLDHERQDRAHERENWRKTLERTQANLLAAQDTPTARALAGAPKPAAVEVTAQPPKPPRKNSKAVKPPWWQTMFH